MLRQLIKPLHRRTAMAFRTRAVAAIGSLAVALLWWVVPMAPARAAGVTAVPTPDHVVILVLENHSISNILDNPDAPYINSLATSGANMTQSYAETHPSQPNYIALFSGSTNGLTDDSCPHTYTTDNLGAQAIAAGIGFTGYSEGLPSVGYTGCTSGRYARKHNPWVNFSNVPAASNQPLTSFPTDYSTLPAISFVIPNLDHDMHDGTIAQGDTWIHDNLDGYVQWAKTHNSVLVLTFDEDDNTPANQIPTVMVGQRVQPGQYSEHIDHYNVLRTIQDGFGLPPLGNSATAAPILDIWTPAPGAPQAAFTLNCADLTCSADGSASTATTGTITAWDWTWGDGAATSGTTSSHTYATPGDYTVTLRVTDDSARTAQTTHIASARSPGGGTVFASDGFGRTSSSGFGLADIGGVWAVAGSASNYTVAGGAGLIRIVAGSGPNAYLGSVSSTDTDMTADVSLDKIGNSGTTQVALVGRGNSSNAYRGKLGISPAGAVTAYLTKVVAGVESTVVQAAVTGLTYTAGTTLHLRLQVVGSGPTSLKFKVWKGSDAEPSAWRLSTTDATAAVQTAGGIGLWSYTSGAVTNGPLTLSVDNVSARPTAAPPANVPPVARFTSTTSDLTASLNASTSTDSDGTISSYSWDYGDTTTGTGASPTHTYTTANTYQVTLTVTDNNGATNAVTHPVTVTAPAGGSIFATDAFGRTSASGFGTADLGGAWTVAGTASNYTVASGVGKIRIATPGSGPNAYLNSVSSTDTDLTADVALDKIGNSGSTQVALVGRGNSSNAYRGKIATSPTGAVTAYLTKVVAGAETTLIQTSVTGMTYTAGTTLHLRLQVVGSGPTSLKFKVWKGSDAEPSAWRLSTTDSTAAVQSAGGIGVWTYLSSAATNAPVTISIDNVAAQHTN
jgi:PKD repeat protein